MQRLKYYVEKYGSDKVLSEYTLVYEPAFKNIREEVKSFLEIGIGTQLPDIPSTFIGNPSHYPHYKPGGSLRAWRDYFPNAQVYGIDIGEDCKFEEERIKTFIFSSTDSKEVNKNLKDLKFDIIVDDGLHTAEGQMATMRNFFNRVNDGGYYIIEDCGGGGDGLNIVHDLSEEFKEYADDHEWFWRGNIVLIRKNNSKKGQNKSFEDFFGESPDVENIKKLNNTNPKEDENIQSIKSQISTLSKQEKENLIKYLNTPSLEVNNTELTVVTGLWNIGRPGRDFSHYIEHFKRFLEIPVNMFIYIPAEYEYLVWEVRSKENTYVKLYELDDVKNLYKPFWERTQNIRTNPEWYNQTGENGWLKGSPQAFLEWYNPIVQSKMFMLSDASIWDPFGSEYFIWLDAGITNTVHDKLFIEDRALDKINKHLDSFLFLSYPYETNTEIHGFNKQEIDRIAGTDVNYVCRGGLFGGRKDVIREANSDYYNLLDNTLNRGLMGTEESIFSIMAKLNPDLYRRYELDGNGLIVKYIQNLINDNADLVDIPQIKKRPKSFNPSLKNIKSSLYMLTFNFPQQVEHTLAKWQANSPDWLSKPRKILIDNSTDEQARIGNAEVAAKYGFEHIIMNENKGINGGRMFAAEHFQESDSDFYFFFEDDMGFNPSSDNGFCRNGFRNYVPNLYDKVHKIMLKEGFDFLKLSFTEVYMDNNIQVSWYNVPQDIRTRDWPDYDRLPISGLDPNAPRTQFKNIDVFEDVSYISGDIYYANWPMIVGKEGNQKMFLDTKWAHPFEQTWMSYMYQETKKGNLNPAVLLASPVWHERIVYYKPEERREN